MTSGSAAIAALATGLACVLLLHEAYFKAEVNDDVPQKVSNIKKNAAPHSKILYKGAIQPTGRMSNLSTVHYI